MDLLSADVDYGTSTLVSGSWAEGMIDDDAPSLAVLMVCITNRDLMIEKIGVLEAKNAIDRCIKRVIRVAAAYNGQVVETPERDLIASFDQVDFAVQAAIEMQSRIADLPPISCTRLAIKIGLSYGAAVADCRSALGSVADVASTLAGQAESGQILACIRAHYAFSPEVEKRFGAYCREWMELKAAARGASSGNPVSGPVVTTAVPIGDDGVQPPRGFILKCGGRIYVLEESLSVIKIGRADDNQIVLTGNRASRYHANIKRRGTSIVLTDTSTNGTLLSFQDGTAPFRLVNGERVLHGAGVLTFSPSGLGAIVGITRAKFEIL